MADYILINTLAIFFDIDQESQSKMKVKDLQHADHLYGTE